MPSIASTYKRNRKEHDNTARKWTQLYALPPKKAVEAIDTAKTTNDKGKGKATTTLSDTLQQEQRDKICVASRTSNKRRAETATNDVVISLLSDSEDSDHLNACEDSGKAIDLTKSRSKRRRGTSAENSQAGKSKVRRLAVPGTLDDVIVIED